MKAIMIIVILQTESLKDDMVKIKLPTEHVGKYLIMTHYVGNYREYCLTPNVMRTSQDMEYNFFSYQERYVTSWSSNQL